MYWSVLSKDDFTLWEAAPYARHITGSVLKTDGPLYKLSALVPFGDNLLRAHQIEQLVQQVRRSSLADRLLELDPLNTYDLDNLQYPSPGQTHSELPDGVTVRTVYDESAFVDLGQGSPHFSCSVNPVAGTITVNGTTSDFTATNNLSSPVELGPGFTMYMKGDLGVTNFEFLIILNANPKTDWKGTLDRVTATSWRWEDPELKDIAEQDPLWTNRLAAYVVSAVEDNLRG
jgi:hypothetical protein